MKNFFFVLFMFAFLNCLVFALDKPIIIDHTCTNLPQVPSSWIEKAKQDLHIAYGHTSHGSQVTDGMTGLVTFTGGCGGPQFAWNNGGTGGALDLHDYAMGGDCGYYPQWVINTQNYLNDPTHADVNVIIWSWCGQHAYYTEQDMIDKYLAPMAQLELDYPDVMFVYMTGHLTHGNIVNCNARNQQIRDYCRENNKILYDFAHIESFDPDPTYFPYADDDCDYYNAAGVQQGNWAVEWQNSHILGVDWYQCGAAHTQPLNSNQKAYAAWWLWTSLAGWSGPAVDPLTFRTPAIPASIGGAVLLDLKAGAAYPNRNYLMLGTVSGTHPGFPLPGGLVSFPINWDPFTNVVVSLINTSLFSNFLAFLDASGQSMAQVKSPPVNPFYAGIVMHFAYALNDPWNFVSNPVAIEIVP